MSYNGIVIVFLISQMRKGRIRVIKLAQVSKIQPSPDLFAAAAAKSLQSCPTLCDPIDGSPPGSPVPGTLQARTLEWVAISFSNARKWKMKVKSLSRVRLFVTPWTAAFQAPPSMDFPGKSTGVGCHPDLFTPSQLVILLASSLRSSLLLCSPLFILPTKAYLLFLQVTF